MIIEKAILKIYPDLNPFIDFVVSGNPETGETFISEWDESKYPKPTKEELEVAWKKIDGENPPPTPPTVEDILAENNELKKKLADMEIKHKATEEAQVNISNDLMGFMDFYFSSDPDSGSM